MRQHFLERHGGRSGRHRRAPGNKIYVDAKWYEDQTDNQTDYEGLQRALLKLKLAVYTFGSIFDRRELASYRFAAMLTEKETPPVRAALVSDYVPYRRPP
jgi:hypothetical protein